MPVTVEKLPDERIVIVNYVGRVTPDEMDQAAAQIEALVQNVEPPIYRIGIGCDADVTFPDIVRLMPKVTFEKSAVSTRDTRFIDVAVLGDNRIARIAIDSLGQEQYGAARFTLFADLDTAVAHARAELARE